MPLLRRVAMLSVHTSPLERPGTGDAGGLNVYVLETARQLAKRGIAVDIFTRRTNANQPAAQAIPASTVDGGEAPITIRHIAAGPYEGLDKEDLPGQLCAFTAGLMGSVAAQPEGYYDVVHSHYWLSGQVGWLAADRWHVPLVHTMHTMARVKNLHASEGETREPIGREIGEAQVVVAADALVANTSTEASELIELYDAPADEITVIPPGVDLETFAPDPRQPRVPSRTVLGLSEDAEVLLFVGRLQQHKAPDMLLRVGAELIARQPARRDRLVLAVLGGPSGRTSTGHPHELHDLAVELGVSDNVRFVPPVDRPTLAEWYRAADLVIVPSHSESFGLVAIEAQACGTPVVAAHVGGLPTAVGDAGVLVRGRDLRDWTDAVEQLLDDPSARAELANRAVAHAAAYGWAATTDRLIEVYEHAMSQAFAGMPASQV